MGHIPAWEHLPLQNLGLNLLIFSPNVTFLVQVYPGKPGMDPAAGGGIKNLLQKQRLSTCTMELAVGDVLI